MIQGNNIKQIEIATGDLRIFKNDAMIPTKIYNVNDDLYLINNNGKILEKYTLPSNIPENVYELNQTDYDSNEKISFIHNSSNGISLVVEKVTVMKRHMNFILYQKIHIVIIYHNSPCHQEMTPGSFYLVHMIVIIIFMELKQLNAQK